MKRIMLFLGANMPIVLVLSVTMRLLAETIRKYSTEAGITPFHARRLT